MGKGDQGRRGAGTDQEELRNPETAETSRILEQECQCYQGRTEGTETGIQEKREG